jgi:MoxR-like ATPase
VNVAWAEPAEASPQRAASIDTQRLTILRTALNAALRGKREVVEQVLACVLAGGHLLIEDLPGLGKTTLAKALATAVGGQFQRVQCTPDLLPGDITGFNVFNQKTREFEFLPGPVFADVLLVDEINRATPRTQSALLEAMAERQVTVDIARHRLSEAFFVIATQNPGDHHGTYPLPEAQLDRFAMKVTIGYPDASEEAAMLADAVLPAERHAPAADRRTAAAEIIGLTALSELRLLTQQVAVARQIQAYLVRLAAETRRHPDIALGVSPRGLLTLQRVAQAQAVLQERDYVIPDDIHDVIRPVLSVRLSLRDRSKIDRVLTQILSDVAVPTTA